MKLAIFYNKKKLSGKLTRFFTGRPLYHVGWYDDATGLFYDMHAIRRRRYWLDYSKGKQFVLVDFPEVHAAHLEHQLNVSEQLYGFMDYALFGIRPIFHVFGQSTRNAGGVICSEMIALDAEACGVLHPWYGDAPPPSPADWYQWALVQDRPMRFVGITPDDL
jgi:hypothetical protein